MATIRKRMYSGHIYKRSPQNFIPPGQAKKQQKQLDEQQKKLDEQAKKDSKTNGAGTTVGGTVGGVVGGVVNTANGVTGTGSTGGSSAVVDSSSGSPPPGASGGKIESQPTGGSSTPVQAPSTSPGGTSNPGTGSNPNPATPKGSGSSDPANSTPPASGTSGSNDGTQSGSPGPTEANGATVPNTNNTSPVGTVSSVSTDSNPVQTVDGGHESPNNPSSSSQSIALPVGITAGIAAVLLLFFIFFMLKRRKVAAKVAAKERYEAMMANNSLPRTPEKAPEVSLMSQQPFGVFQRISALFALQTPSPLPDVNNADDPCSDQAPLRYSNPNVATPPRYSNPHVATPFPAATTGSPLKSAFTAAPESRVSIVDEPDRLDTPSPVPIDIEAPVLPKSKRESVGWFGTTFKTIRSVDSVSILSRDTVDRKRLTGMSLAESDRISVVESMKEKNKSFLSSNSSNSSPKKWSFE